MRDGARQRIRSLALRAGIHAPLRALYNFLVLSRATRTIELAGTRRTFRTPTRTIIEQVESFAGERYLLEEFFRSLRPDDCVWDVGSSFGLYSIFAAEIVRGRDSVIAFEPEPRMRTLLKRNCALNHLTNVIVAAHALGDVEKNVTLFQAATPNVGTSALAARQDYRLREKGITVSMRRGDACVASASFRAPTILKVDVEGAEARVLAGFGSILRDDRLRCLYCEVHPHLLPSFGDSVESLQTSIAEAGLTISSRIRRGTEYHLVCRR